MSAAGKYGEYVGRVELLLDDDHKIIEKRAQAIATADMPVDARDVAEIRGYLEQGHALLQKEYVATLPYDLTNDETKSFPLTQVALNAVAEFAGVHAAVLNTGLFLSNLEKGEVNQDHLHQTLPHPMHIIRVELSGADFSRMVREMEKNRNFLRKFPIRGMGFRGKIFGELVYKGIYYDRVTKEVYYQGEPVEDDKTYKFATVDHFMFIPFFPTIELVGKVEFLFPEFIRHVVARFLSQQFSE
jgi:2',3'-cyclic-nucleotide 2'-phosphodiesterase (5'-nucleotidase family)